METPVRNWSRLLDGQWLNGAEPRARFCEIARARRAELETLAEGARVLLIEADVVACAAGIAAVFASERPVLLFLGSPQWGGEERESVARDVAPEVIWGAGNGDAVAAGVTRLSQSTHRRPSLMTSAATGDGMEATGPHFLIPTGGTTGGVRFARHSRETLAAAADGLRVWMGGGPLHSVCFLPLFHVSGLMQLVRAWATGGTVTLASWPAIEAGDVAGMPIPPGASTSIVPTQLARLLAVPRAVDWLRGFRVVFLGGAAAWRELLDAARAGRIPLAPCYGMTETAAQVVAARPEEFLETGALAGEALPHARVEIVPEGTESGPSSAGGRIRVRADSLFLGYWPEPARRAGGREGAGFLTSDRGRLDADGRLVVLGRIDALINSGGEKIDPALVEAAIRATGLARDVAVCGAPDREWGEAVVAIIAGARLEDEAAILAELRARLSPAHAPKRFVHAREVPRTAAGKIDRRALTRLAADGNCAQ